MQGRFKGILVDKNAYLLEVCRYVDLNPLRARMVRDPANWPWSSYRAHTGKAEVAELITRPGLINVDFADVRTVMSETGMAMMGTGAASGENRAREAAQAAISSPLLEDVNLAGANGILVNVTAGLDLAIGEFEEVGRIVKEFAADDATVVVGTVIDPEMSNQVRVTVVATGLGRGAAQRGRGEPGARCWWWRGSSRRSAWSSRARP